MNIHQLTEYNNASDIEAEFKLEHDNNSNGGNGGYAELREIFSDDDTDDEILAMVNEFNNQPVQRSRNRNGGSKRSRSRNRNGGSKRANRANRGSKGNRK